MWKVYYDMIYLAACGVNGVSPKREYLNELDMAKLEQVSHAHMLDALVGMTLKPWVSISKEWAERISKAVRKNILFDAERAKLLAFMEQQGIWYLPLKGVILKDYYPAVGMRQMSDNDILFDESFRDVLKEYMKSQGYKGVNVGLGNHDEYEKKPVYNFELHRALYDTLHGNEWRDYYKDVKKRLIPDSGSSYGYHFRDEDFYVYILSHTYKHYSGSGTGLRSLLDFYVYLKAKEQEMDFAYIQRECEVLGIAEFERLNRGLCKKVFSQADVSKWKELEWRLSEEEKDMLENYLSLGVYGTVGRRVENRMGKFRKKSGSDSRLLYLLTRLFPDMETYKNYYPFFYKHKWLLPVGWLYRALRMLFSKKRRKKMVKEIKAVKEVCSHIDN